MERWGRAKRYDESAVVVVEPKIVPSNEVRTNNKKVDRGHASEGI